MGPRALARARRAGLRARARNAAVKAYELNEAESEAAREAARETIARAPVISKGPDGRFVPLTEGLTPVRRVAGVGPAMSLARMLRSVAEEVDGEGVSQKEHIARIVVAGARRGDKWCIEFLADRTEGRPAQALQIDLKRENPLEGASEEELHKLELLLMEKIATGEWKPLASEGGT